jgi:CDP-diacylglycerol--glycerol-3-phosphate 3-phosphatidyltransferase
VPTLLPRSAPAWLTDPIVDAMHRLGVTPNMLTIAGVAGNVGAAVAAGYGEFLVAGAVVLIASSLDFLDGALARRTGTASDFGAVLDAVMDRVSEAAVLFGLLVYFSDRGEQTETLLIFVAVVGSVLVSYVRARAETIGQQMREGIFTRLERVLLIGVGLIAAHFEAGVLTVVLWILAVLASATALQRLALVWWKSREA